MLLAPAPGEFTPAPLSRDVAPAAPPAGDWPAETADWPGPGTGPGSGPGPEPGARPPASPPPARRGLRGMRPALAVAAVLVVIIGVAAAFALSRHHSPGDAAAGTPASPRTSPTGTPSAMSSPPPASRQAAALTTLLISSSTARTALHRAVKQVAGCTNLSGAIGDLQDVVNQRSTEYSRASALMVSALPDGAKVKTKLTTALSLSLKADQDYLTWARQQRASGCTPTSQSGTYNAAFSTSQRADAAKEAFVQAWNPVAARFGLAQSSARNI